MGKAVDYTKICWHCGSTDMTDIQNGVHYGKGCSICKDCGTTYTKPPKIIRRKRKVSYDK